MEKDVESPRLKVLVPYRISRSAALVDLVPSSISVSLFGEEEDITQLALTSYFRHNQSSHNIIIPSLFGEEEDITQLALTSYFRHNQSSHNIIIPHLRRHIRDATVSPKEEDRAKIILLKRMLNSSSLDQSEQAWNYLQAMILSSTADALQQTEELGNKYKKESEKKLSKRTVFLSNAAIGLLGIVATLFVHFTDKDCS